MEGTYVSTPDEIGALCGSEAEMCHLHNPPGTLGFELLSLDPAMSLQEWWEKHCSWLI